MGIIYMAERPTNYIPPEARGLTEEEDQIRNLISEKISSDKAEWKHFTPEFVGTKSQSISVHDLVEQINNANKQFEESRISQKEGLIKIKGNLPISIVHIGDTHLGSIYTDTDEVLRKLRLIRETPNCYVVFMANLIDNAIPSQYPNNMLVNAIPPDKQVLMMRNIIQQLNDSNKVLGAVTSPCHEGWTFKNAGQDVNALIYGFKERKFPVLQNGGRLTIQIGKQRYLGILLHQVGPFESNFNETHALRQLNRLNYLMEADWIAGAHRHFAAAETVYEGNGDHRKIVGYIRTGTEKGTGSTHDMFSVDRYGRTGEHTGQTIHLWGNIRRLLTTLDFDDAVLAHESFYLTEMAREGARNK